MSTLARAQGVSRYQPEDAEALHAFQRETFGPEARQADPAYFHWLFEENPHREPAGIHFWLVRRQNAVVGQQGGVPFPLKVGAGTARASWAVDLMVAPAWRLRGVGPVLTETQAASADVVLALGISDPAYKAYQRAGWIDLGHIPIYLRPLDIRRCLEVIPEGGEWLRRLARLAAPIAEGAVPAARAMAAVAGTRLEPADAFDARADAVWIEAAPRYPVIARRDFPTLAWRYDQVPTSGRYRRFILMQGNRPRGWLVLRIETWRDEPMGVVVDYLARPGWLAPLFAHALDLGRREGVIALMTRTRNRPGHAVLSALGFLRRDIGTRLPTRLMAHLGPGGERLRPLVAEADNWFVTYGDSDIGHREMVGEYQA